MLIFTFHFFPELFDLLTKLLKGKILGQQTLTVKVFVYDLRDSLALLFETVQKCSFSLYKFLGYLFLRSEN